MCGASSVCRAAGLRHPPDAEPLARHSQSDASPQHDGPIGWRQRWESRPLVPRACQRLRRHHVPRERAPSALDWTSRSHRRHSIHRRRPLPRAARVAETRLAAGRRRLSDPPRVRRPPAVRLAPAAPALRLRHLAESGRAFPPQCFASEARRNGRACPSLLQTTSNTSRRLGFTTPPIPTPPIDPNLPAAGAAVAPAAGHAGRSGSDAAAARPAS